MDAASRPASSRRLHRPLMILVASAMPQIFRLAEAEARSRADDFVALLTDVVDHGASVGFLRPLDPAVAREYWEEVFGGLAKGSKILLVARDGDAIVGSVQLELAGRPNGRHRAEVQKLIVSTQYRRKGIATQLMNAIEREAQAAGRWLLILDTEQHSDAEPFYEQHQWIRCGSIPNFAANTDGVPTPNVIFHKMLS